MADDKMKDNKDAESGEPVQLDKDQQHQQGGQPARPQQGQPGQQQPGGQPQRPQHQPGGGQHEGGQKR